jgi:hypothetical protein
MNDDNILKLEGTPTMTTQPKIDISQALAEPFPVEEVRWKPQAVSGNRALAIAYIDARSVMDRLDDTVGPAGWQDDYHFLADGAVLCKLRLHLDGVWITKMDVGGQSDQPDGGDRLKAAVSDALKRAAVKFGIGRYLYDLPRQWVDYDPQRKQFVRTPTLPPWAVPKSKGPETITQEQGRILEGLVRAGKVKWEDFAERYQIVRLGQLPKTSFEDAKSWLTGRLEAGARKTA